MPVILSFVADWPNIVTLLGLCSGVLAIFLALEQNYPAAMIAMLPVIILGLAGQKHIVKGLTVGAIKGGARR